VNQRSVLYWWRLVNQLLVEVAITCSNKIRTKWLVLQSMWCAHLAFRWIDLQSNTFKCLTFCLIECRGSWNSEWAKVRPANPTISSFLTSINLVNTHKQTITTTDALYLPCTSDRAFYLLRYCWFKWWIMTTNTSSGWKFWSSLSKSKNISLAIWKLHQYQLSENMRCTTWDSFPFNVLGELAQTHLKWFFFMHVAVLHSHLDW
jgi:hypothetical protein